MSAQANSICQVKVQILFSRTNMNDKQYNKFLKKAPKATTKKFLEFLKKNNEVTNDFWIEGWLVIKNCKYNTAKQEWRTAFYIHKGEPKGYELQFIFNLFKDWEILKKAPSKQTIPSRFHLHLIKK